MIDVCYLEQRVNEVINWQCPSRASGSVPPSAAATRLRPFPKPPLQVRIWRQAAFCTSGSRAWHFDDGCGRGNCPGLLLGASLAMERMEFSEAFLGSGPSFTGDKRQGATISYQQLGRCRGRVPGDFFPGQLCSTARPESPWGGPAYSLLFKLFQWFFWDSNSQY